MFFLRSKILSKNLTRNLSQLRNNELVIKHHKEKPGLLELGLNRGAAKNSFSKSLLKSLQSAIHDIRQDTEVRVVVLRSLVPGIFSAGADLKERLTLTEPEVVEFVSSLRSTFQDLSTIPPPTIAALDGVALGGGLELALACDIRIASDTVKLGLVETKLGIIPGAGGTQRLSRLINPAIAKELILTARVIDGKEAEKVGIVNQVVKSNASGDAAYQKAMEIAEKIVVNGPLAVRLAKQAVDQGLDVDIETGLKLEEQLYAKVIPTRDRIEGLKAFREKRVPVYTGQ